MKRPCLALALGTLLLCIAQGRAATTQLVSVSVTADFQAQLASFRIEFNQPPDFFTLDQFDRVADSFQFFISNEPGPLPFSIVQQNLNGSIIRGDEIHVANDLPIRNVRPADETDPNAGGWGTVRDRVDYTLADSVVTFDASFSALNVTDQGFRWGLLIAHFGSSDQPVIFGAVPVPLPPAIWSGLILIGALATAAAIRRNRRTQARQ